MERFQETEKPSTTLGLLEAAAGALRMGDTAEAARLAWQCLDISRSNPKAHHILALAAIEHALYADAIEHCEAALRRHKGAEIYQDLAFCQLRTGNPAGAVLSARKAAQRAPRNANVLNILGVALEQAGEFAEAALILDRAFEIDPGSLQIVGNLVRIQTRIGDHQKVASAVARQLALSKSPSAGAQFVEAIANAPKPDLVPNAKELLLWAAASDCTRAVALCTAILRFLEADAGIRTLLIDISNRWPQTEYGGAFIEDPVPARLIADPLFQQALRTAPLSSPFWEKFLTVLRQAIAATFWQHLTNGRVLPASFLTVLAALAEQSALNEYVHAVSPGEANLVANLAESVRLHRSGPANGLKSGVLALLACYGPLRQLDLGRPLAAADYANESDLVRNRHLEIPGRVAAAMADLPALTRLDDGTAAVRAQYEADPYPFWNRAASAPPVDIERQVELSVGRPLARALPFASRRSILIAGCGTGQQSAEAAIYCPQADILAIDLSRTSLGFAADRSRDHGIDNIAFAQADILALALDKKFHYIESTGVLHHLPDPVAGWRILRDHLLPAGIMRISLYSAKAREPLAAVKELLAMHGLNASTALLDARQHILAQTGAPWETVTGAPDFYSRNGTRDLLFHECEHQFTLLQIEEIVADLDLEFLGLKTPAHFRPVFEAMFPGPAAATDFKAWDAFEQANPAAFASMYEMYLQAPS